MRKSIINTVAIITLFVLAVSLNYIPRGESSGKITAHGCGLAPANALISQEACDRLTAEVNTTVHNYGFPLIAQKQYEYRATAGHTNAGRSSIESIKFDPRATTVNSAIALAICLTGLLYIQKRGK